MDKNYGDAQDVADRYGVAKKSVYNWTSARSIPFLKVGGRVRFDLDALDEWFAARGAPEDAA